MSDKIKSKVELTDEDIALLAWALGLATGNFLRTDTEASKKAAAQCLELHNKIQRANPGVYEQRA